MKTRRVRLWMVAVLAGTLAWTAAGSAASAREDAGTPGVVREQLTGYQEDPMALSTTGNGRIVLRISEQRQEIGYRLSYSSLEGNVTQAHIHLGGRAQSGGISVFFCSNLGNGPAGTQACPPAPATVTGTIRPADVIGPGGQGITAGQFAELLAAIRAGTTYANVHSTLYPGGEIRGQLNDHHH